MSRRQTRHKRSGKRPYSYKRQRSNLSVSGILQRADKRAKSLSNRKIGERDEKTCIRAAIDGVSADYPPISMHMPAATRAIRWMLAFLMMPLSGITALTFFQQLAADTTSARFWTSSEFWYFATGLLLMCGWFFTRLFEPIFLYFYVLGHELTHAAFVLLSFGKVTEIKVGLEGGYITTNKSNILIALSPYFIPFWAMVFAAAFALLKIWYPLPYHDKITYFFLGGTWGFHMLWTIWMIPRDQPDLKENDTFFSMALIVLANLCIFSVLLCVASRAITGKEFIYNWIHNAQTLWGDLAGYLTRLIS